MGGGVEEETGVAQCLKPLGANRTYTLLVRAFRHACLCINQPEYIRPVKSITPSEQALHQAALVSLECIQTETANLLRVGVITDQINCL